jgi:glycosyltransferase involved in cell wall biosynthesis
MRSSPLRLSPEENSDRDYSLNKPRSRPTLLAISPIPPWPARDGMSLRVSRLLEHLASRWSIVLICPAGGEPAAANGVELAAEIAFPHVGKWMYVPSQYDVEPVVRTVSEAVRAHRPTLALLWGGMEYLSEHVPGMPPSISDRVDCMTLSSWRLLTHARGLTAIRRRLAHFAYVARYEFSMRRSSRAMVVVGDADASVLRRFLRVRNVHVIPNGVDVSDTPDIGRSSRPTVMFTGVMNYQPNIDAVVYFANEIWPAIQKRLPDAVFQIVGRSPTPEILAFGQRPGIEVHADVESVQAFLARAWLAVAPMLTGCGIKNKVLEAWSVGTPAVMTPIATNGLSSAPSELLLTGEGPELSALVVELLTNEDRRTKLGALARSTAVRSFSWQEPAAAINALLQQVAEVQATTADLENTLV